MLVAQDEGYNLELIGIAVRWKTAFHLTGALLLQGYVLRFLPGLSHHRPWGKARAMFPPARSCNAVRSSLMHLSQVPRRGRTLATRTREARFAHRHTPRLSYIHLGRAVCQPLLPASTERYLPRPFEAFESENARFKVDAIVHLPPVLPVNRGYGLLHREYRG